MKVDLYTVEWRSPEEFAVAFTATQNAEAKGVVILGSPVFSAQLMRLADLATRHRIVATYVYRAFVEAGGLISYGPLESDPSFSRRRAAYFVDKLLYAFTMTRRQFLTSLMGAALADDEFSG